MITIEEETLKQLVLKSEPGFIEQVELQMDNYGVINKFANEDVWIWNRERFKQMDENELAKVILKVIAR